MKKFLLLIVLFLSFGIANAQLFLQDNFDYGTTAGDLVPLTNSKWAITGTASTTAEKSFLYKTTSLSMDNYPNSGVGGSAGLVGTRADDVNSAFESQNSGFLYASALINLTSTGNDDYFFHFKNDGTGFYGRVFTKASNGKAIFGIQSTSTAGFVKAYGTKEYELNTTYLLVLKYDFSNGSSTVYVLDAVTETEPTTPEAVSTATAIAPFLLSVSLRQGSNIPTVTVDGIRVAKAWGYIMANPPTIANIMTTPTVPTSSEAVSVSADVTDAANAITSVKLKWGTAKGTYTGGTIDMTIPSKGSPSYQASIPAQADGTVVYYIIEATNSKNLVETSAEKSYTVTDPNTAPEVTNLAISPTAPTSTQLVLVTANVSDAENNLASVNLKWGTKTGEYTGGTIKMNLNVAKTTNSQYITETPIPAQAASTVVYFVIEATDAKDEKTTSPEQSYTVDPSTGIDAIATSFKMYPNPATSILNIKGENIKLIAITNIAGQELVKLSVIENQTSIDVQGLEKGIYFVKVTTSEGAMLVNKFIKE